MFQSVDHSQLKFPKPEKPIERALSEPAETVAEVATEAADIVGETTKTPLPEDFPALQILIEAGYETLESVSAASDEDLLNIPGIGRATLQRIREA